MENNITPIVFNNSDAEKGRMVVGHENNPVIKPKSTSEEMVLNIPIKDKASASNINNTIAVLKGQLDQIAERGEDQSERLASCLDDTLLEVKSNFRRRQLADPNVLYRTESTTSVRLIDGSNKMRTRSLTTVDTDIEQGKLLIPLLFLISKTLKFREILIDLILRNT